MPVDEPTAAIAELLLLHVPPAEISVKVVVAVWQTLVPPEIGAGVPVTETVIYVKQLPESV